MWLYISRALVPPVVIALVAWKGPEYSLVALLVAIAAFIATGGRHRWPYILYKTIPRDMKILTRFVKLQLKIKSLERKGMTAHRLFLTHAKKHPAKAAFYYEDQTWTYKKMDDMTGRIASAFHAMGYKRGDVVALVCHNRPEYVAMWLGLSRIGVITALVNSNLRRQPLLHSLTTALNGCCRAIVIEDGELAEALSEIQNELPKQTMLFQLGRTKELMFGADDLDVVLEGASPAGPGAGLEAIGRPTDKLLYIYTSGTTGLPKAAVITHVRFMFMTLGVNYMLNIEDKDVIYNALPLYHTAGGMIGVGQVLVCGGTMALRRKFSVTNFWKDCTKHNCTVAQYIGEICRYLLSAPERPEDRGHRIRLMFGNGLRPQIWENFVKRFNIGQIGEFYGATEGNSNIVNLDNKVGAVGFVPRYTGPVYPVGLIRVDEYTEEPIRDSQGLCIPCQPEEPGLFVGKINTNNAANAFHGYTDRKASEKKILFDVFEKGDTCFNSGDILVSDEFGYYYFKDRTGDTFRWKGENVASSEVEAVISNVAQLSDAVVYGVEISGAEGRAGMAAVVGEPDTENLKRLETGIKKSLPSYARPVFLRVLKEVPLTGTFKLKKRDLQLEGYNPAVVSDPLFIADPSTYEFKPLDAKVYQDIIDKKIRF